MIHIAIIEDDIGLNNGITLAFKNENYIFHQYYALSEVRNPEEMDLIILDINLPDGNGLNLLRTLRRTSQVPVIILTANDLESDEVTGLELGADDYITKPFSLMVLRARMDKLLKKVSRTEPDIYHQDRFYFDFRQMKFLKGEQEIELSKTEQKLLRILVMNKNTTILRDVLIDRIWSEQAEFVDENALSVTMKRLRDKLEENSSKPRYIQTVYGLGYVWRAE
jgi:DNA-binding response OmpR family regulator